MAISYRTATLDVAQLDVDLQNPRGNPTSSQTDAMRELLAVEGNGEKVFVLALSICELAMLDPADRLYVIETSPDRYTVLDGNRRLTALRLLSQSNLVDREELQLPTQVRNRFKKLQTKYPGAWPQKVDVVIFEDRESANRMIRLRHTGENEGAGRSSWSALQVARFDDAPSWRAISELRKRGKLELHTLNRLARGDFAITNFERVAGTDRFKTLFGSSLASFQRDPFVVSNRGISALAKLANDVASGRVTSRDEFEKEETMGAYFSELNKAISPVDDQDTAEGAEQKYQQDAGNEERQRKGGQDDGHPDYGSDRDGGDPRADASPGTGATGAEDTDNHDDDDTKDADVTEGKRQRRKPQSKYLIERKTSIVVTDAKCRDIFDELKGKVVVESAPYACALLLRSLLEITAEIYARDILKKTSNTSANLDATANHLKGSSTPGEASDRLELAKAFATASREYSNLSSAAHDQYHIISPAHVRATWKSLSGGMDLAWKRIASANSPK